MTFYLNIDDGSELAEVFVEFSDVVELPRDLAHLQLGVNVVVPLGESVLVLVVKARPEMKPAGLNIAVNDLKQTLLAVP